MRSLSISIFMLMAAITSASAQGFFAYGGYVGGAHHIIEPAFSGFASASGVVIAHGSLPVISASTSGISAVSVTDSKISVTISDDGLSLIVAGAPAGSRYSIVAVDGRMVRTGRVTAAIPLESLSAGHYLLHVDGGSAFVYRFIKRR